jgi:quinolinate synthase
MKDLRVEISNLKEKYKAVILAHNYQLPEIQDIADFVGDSLDLSKAAAQTEAEVIVFCGVSFMAETAALLSPNKRVLLPDLGAGCPLADMIDVKRLLNFREQFPGLPVVCYINTSAEVKALSDICCTSSSALKIVEALPEQELLFIPDQCLGSWIAAKSQKTLHLYPGFCPTHHRLFAKDIEEAKAAHPEALVLAHPECLSEVLQICDYVGGTMGMVKYVKESKARKFIIGTEAGIIYRMQKENPDKTFILPTDRLICPNMKLTTLEKVYWALEEQKHIITVPTEYRAPALRAINKMLELSR